MNIRCYIYEYSIDKHIICKDVNKQIFPTSHEYLIVINFIALAGTKWDSLNMNSQQLRVAYSMPNERS